MSMERCDVLVVGGGPAGLVGGADQLIRGQHHAVVGAGHTRDRFLHQRAAEVVDAPTQRLGGGVEAHLHPARLQAPHAVAQREPEGGGVLQILLARDLLDPMRAAKHRVERDE